MVFHSQLVSWLHNKMDMQVGLWGMKRAGIGANTSWAQFQFFFCVPLSRFLEQCFSNEQWWKTFFIFNLSQTNYIFYITLSIYFIYITNYIFIKHNKINYNSPLLKYRLHIVTSFKRVHGREMWEDTLEKTDSHHLSHMTKININSNKSCW